MPGPQDWTPLKEILVGHCEAIGRDPAEITCSVNVRLNEVGGIGPGAELAAQYQDVGVDLVIFNLPQPFDATVLEPLAEAVSAARLTPATACTAVATTAAGPYVARSARSIRNSKSVSSPPWIGAVYAGAHRGDGGRRRRLDRPAVDAELVVDLARPGRHARRSARHGGGPTPWATDR